MKKCVLLLIAGLLLRLPGQGQPTYARGPGSYQLADSSWRRAKKIEFDGTTLTVNDTGKNKSPLLLAAKDLKQFEVERDTFLLVRDLPGWTTTEPEWVESLFYQRGVRLLQQFAGSADIRWYLALPQEPLQALSTQRTEFKETMLELVKDCPALVRKITRDSLGRDRVIEILEEYVECQGAPPRTAREPESEPAAEPGSE